MNKSSFINRIRGFFDSIEGAEEDAFTSGGYPSNKLATTNKANTRDARIVFSRASIDCLLTTGSPPPISRFVVTIIVDPVYSHTLRTHTNIRNEIRKMVPALAHFNATPTVVGVRRVIMVVTAAQHIVPSSIQRMVVKAVGGATFDCQTSARFGVACGQLIRDDNASAAAFTHAVPSSTTTIFGILSTRDYSKTIEFLTSKVDEFWHSVTYKLSHLKSIVATVSDITGFGFDALATKVLYMGGKDMTRLQGTD